MLPLSFQGVGLKDLAIHTAGCQRPGCSHELSVQTQAEVILDLILKGSLTGPSVVSMAPAGLALSPSLSFLQATQDSWVLSLALHGLTHGLWLPQMIWAQRPSLLNATEPAESLGLTLSPGGASSSPVITITYHVPTAPGQAVSSAA